MKRKAPFCCFTVTHRFEGVLRDALRYPIDFIDFTQMLDEIQHDRHHVTLQFTPVISFVVYCM